MLVTLVATLVAALQLAVLPLVSTTAAAQGRTTTTSVVGADADGLGTNWYPSAGISPAQVNTKDFGELFNLQLPSVAPADSGSGAGSEDAVPPGQIYAQPIVADGVLLVVTETDNAYGLNPKTGAVKWERNFGAAFQSSVINCGDLAPNVGITGTPVVDSSTGIAYFTTDTIPAVGQSLWQMQAVDIATGTEVANFPVSIKGPATNDPSETFDPVYQMQRPGLAYVDGEVYAAFGAHCDFSTWYGWIAGVSTGGVLDDMWVDETGGGDGAGIWGPGGIVVDSEGNLYVATGNSNGNGNTPGPGSGLGAPQPAGLGECVLKLATGGAHLQLADYFCPSDAAVLNNYDGDLGSGSPTGLPASFGTSKEPDLLVEAGKSGEVYLLDRDDLGGVDEGPGGSDDVVQETGPRGGEWSHPAVWPGDGGYVYITTGSPGARAGGTSGELDIYQRVATDGDVSLNWVGDVPGMHFGSSAPIVTSNGTQAGSAIVWEIVRTSSSNDGAQLRAYGAAPVAGTGSNAADSLPLLWHAFVGNSTKFDPPLASGGRIYVGNSDGQILAFGTRKGAPPLAGAAVRAPDTVLGSTSKVAAVFTATGPVTVSAVSVSVSTSGASGAFLTTGLASPVHLSAGKTITVPISFDPKIVGGQQGTLTLTTNLGTVSVTLSGRGLPEGVPIAATPTALDFGLQPIGGGVVQRTVSFENTSKSPFTVDALEIESGAPAPFAVGTVSAPLPSLAPGTSLDVPVDFTPPATSGDFVQNFTDHLVITTSAGEAVVPLAGSAAPPPQITISSLSLNVGTVATGQSGIVSFTVGNRGGTPLEITKSKPPTGLGFSAVTSLPEGTVVAAHTNLVETVRFSPTSGGAAQATWVINGDDSSGLQTITISGTGAAEHVVPSILQPGWHLSGRAALSKGNLWLTPVMKDTAGAAFWDARVPTASLRASFTAQMTGGTGGNGLTFALAGTSAVPAEPGRVGTRLGFAGIPAVAVALQTSSSPQNQSRNCIGVVTSAAGAKVLSWRSVVTLASSLRSGPVQVTVIVSDGVLTAELDGFTVLSLRLKLPPYAYVGFTAGTSSLTDRHLISAVEISYR
jgi:outer membrane protein assembly factor BamB